jgi:hypothetical protein
MTPITEPLLRSWGFKWHELERSPHKHWLLWLGDVLPDDQENPKISFRSNEDLGIEITQGEKNATWFFVWLRADYAGRYSRCVCLGHYTHAEQLFNMISAIIGYPFDPSNTWYGSLRSPAASARLRQDDEALHHRIAKDWKPRAAHDEGVPYDPDEKPKNGVHR